MVNLPVKCSAQSLHYTELQGVLNYPNLLSWHSRNSYCVWPLWFVTCHRLWCSSQERSFILHLTLYACLFVALAFMFFEGVFLSSSFRISALTFGNLECTWANQKAQQGRLFSLLIRFSLSSCLIANSCLPLQWNLCFSKNAVRLSQNTTHSTLVLQVSNKSIWSIYLSIGPYNPIARKWKCEPDNQRGLTA